MVILTIVLIKQKMSIFYHLEILKATGFFFLLTASQSIYSHYIMRREIPQGPATINMCRLKICAHILYLIYSVPYMKRPKQIYGVLLQAL